jgi:Uma2 family endonuclease
MVASIFIDRIEVQAGQRVHLRNINWQEFGQILEELGEKRATKVAYYRGNLEIRMPLPEHERAKVFISDFLKILLEELDLEWESLGSSTFKKESMQAGIEPDDCFYIKNCHAVVGIKRLDLNIDPSPDLAIEVDLSSSTQISAYTALGVPEIWQYRKGKLVIFILTEGEYRESSISLNFPSIPLVDGISSILKQNLLMSNSRKEFRKWVRQFV